MKFDEFLFAHLGEIGKYQKIQFVLVCIPSIIVGMHGLSWTFSSVDTPHRCRLPEDPTSGGLYHTSLLNFTKCTNSADSNVPVSEFGKEGVTCHYERCSRPDQKTCSEHVFDHSKVEYTAVERWEITCDRSWIKATIQAAYYVGQMAGSMMFGVLGDRIGRKKVFFLAILIQIACAFLIALAPFWWLYALARAGLGFSHPGLVVIAVVIGMEMVGPRYRKLTALFTALFFALGQVILGIEAMFITNYQVLHLAIATPSLIFLSYWWLVPESPRWLVAQKRYGEADEVLRKAARVNKMNIPDNWWEQFDDTGSASPGKKQASGSDLFKTPELRKRTLVVFFIWPVVSMVYYGMAMKANILGGDIYINFIFAALVEAPALLIVYLLIDRIGRKLLLAGGLFIAGACLLINWLMGDNVQLWMAITQMAFAKGSIAGVYAVIYTYSPELFPTVIRNTAMGFCSTIARVGAIAASYISMWIAEQFGKVFLIIPFGVLALTAAILALLFLPETRGKSLPESIEEIENGDSYHHKSHEMQPLAKGGV